MVASKAARGPLKCEICGEKKILREEEAPRLVGPPMNGGREAHRICHECYRRLLGRSEGNGGAERMSLATEFRFEHCPHCGGKVEPVGPNRKKCEGGGAVYFFCNGPVENGKLRVRELDRSEYRKEVEKKLVAARLKGCPQRD